MTSNKDLKRLVRTRMLKTGEAYTAARAQILKTAKKPATIVRTRVAPRAAGAVSAADPSPAEFAKIAGMSDASVKAKTGCTWERWVKALDKDGAALMSHAEIAKVVHEKWKVGPWWTQMVTVGYERIRGLRARGQQRDGSYQATKSRSFNVPVADLFDAWANVATRKKWMNEAVRVRTATKPKSMRLEWLGGGVVAVGFFAKGAGKSSVAIEELKLPNRDAAAQVKEDWAKRFDALKEILAG